MPVVDSLAFEDWSGRTRTVGFLHDEEAARPNTFRTTILTGQNGSHKSTLLKELVTALALNRDTQNRLTLVGNPNRADPVHVICCSGAVADRFPDKELAGRPTEFDVPNYAYLGQRVGKNLLSKKRPLETMLASALSRGAQERFSWNFFDSAHRLAGVLENTSYELLLQRDITGVKNLLEDIRHLASLPNDDFRSVRHSPQYSFRESYRKILISPATAKWLMSIFDPETFKELHFVLQRTKKFSMSMGIDGPRCQEMSNQALRLGLLADVISVHQANVISRASGKKFSAYDLSSGEYQMFTSLLSLGFGIQRSSVVLVDEPENSLHPQWQREFIESLSEICQRALSDGHLIIGTHSPIIVAAAPEGSSIVDLSTGASEVSGIPFGASSDELLLSQFGMGSSRNRIVVDAVQRAVSLVERGGFESAEFIAMAPELQLIRNALRSNDPLVDVIDALIEEEDQKR